MKVSEIIPCVCIEHERTSADSVFYGMPQLMVAGGGGNQRFTPYCPNCGRGGCSEHKSAYLALKHWNKLMERLWLIKNHGGKALFVLDFEEGGADHE